jgi:N-acetylneuraminate synthase/N,N'-diacetyllegionaminate synthase
MRSIALTQKSIGPGHPCFVIAEAGVNHNGNVGLAHGLIDLAADCGADAVKFQTFEPDSLAASDAPPAAYQRSATAASTQHELLQQLVLPESAWTELAAHARERSLIFLSTPFDLASAEMLLTLGVPALKVPSGELDNVVFLESIATLGVPLLISTGMAFMDEVAQALDVVAAAPAVALLHCVSSYPATSASANLRAVSSMQSSFDVPVGWSDHTVGSVTALGAVALGAALLEKHLTLDRSLPGPDHAASADPVAFRQYVSSVRELESAFGDGVKRPMTEELENRVLVRRSYHAAVDLPSGHVLSADDVALLRPAHGLSPSSTPVGKRVVRRLTRGEPIQESDVD